MAATSVPYRQATTVNVVSHADAVTRMGGYILAHPLSYLLAFMCGNKVVVRKIDRLAMYTLLSSSIYLRARA